MKTLALFALFSVAALLFSAVPAGATTVTECQATIAALVTATQGTTFDGKKPSKAELKLEGELAGASVALDQAKFDKAITKLEDYQKDAAAAAKRGDLAAADADALSVAAGDVITCIQQLGQ